MNLLNMKKAWEKIEFKLIAWKSSGTCIVAQISFEEVSTVLDEHMVLTQQMMSSRIEMRQFTQLSIQRNFCKRHRGLEQGLAKNFEHLGSLGGAAEDVARAATNL